MGPRRGRRCGENTFSGPKSCPPYWGRAQISCTVASVSSEYQGIRTRFQTPNPVGGVQRGGRCADMVSSAVPYAPAWEPFRQGAAGSAPDGRMSTHATTRMQDAIPRPTPARPNILGWFAIAVGGLLMAVLIYSSFGHDGAEQVKHHEPPPCHRRLHRSGSTGSEQCDSIRRSQPYLEPHRRIR